MSLKGKTVLITGASSGIGEATARRLAASGARCVLAARRVERMEKLQKELEASGSEALTVKLDVTSREQCEAAVQAAVEKFGGVDVLVNNAGLMPLSLVEKRKLDEWERMVDVNVKGVLYMTYAALPHLLKSDAPFIVNVSSVAGRKVFPGASVYCGTKYFVRAFSEGLRMELSPNRKVRVVCIEPGAVATELPETITDGDILAAMKPLLEESRILDSEDIANAVGYVLEQPEHCSVNEVLIRPTVQEL